MKCYDRQKEPATGKKVRRASLSALLCLLWLLCGLPATAAGGGNPAQGQAAEEPVRISLLTCAAGGEIYTLFGHTAIRYEHPARGIDVVFNYGIFSFNTPHFVLRFALGETDYQLGLTDYERFAAEYTWAGRDIWQQTLNLTQQEKERLMALLEENYRPENRVYRYNFFYDNCATRPRDQIERAIGGTLQYADNMTDRLPEMSFRKLLHQYSEGHPWARFGMDLCIGSQADRPICRREAMFVPFYAQRYLGQAQVVDTDGKARPLVTREERIVKTGHGPEEFASGGITPMQAAWLLLALVGGATLWGLMKRKRLWGMDLVLFAAAGLAGCVPAFLALFSQHPAVSPNYVLFVLHPLHLFCLPCLLMRVRKRKMSRYMVVNLVVLTLFIVLWGVIPQRIPPAVLPLALCLLLRSASHVLMARQWAAERAGQRAN